MGPGHAANQKKYNDGIFGTPPEPLFNIHPICMSSELLHDYLQVLAEQNGKCMEDATLNLDNYLVPTSAEFVFRASEKLSLPVSAKYLAIELFVRFMTAHIKDLYDYVLGLRKPNRQEEWTAILERIRKQIELRALSCCQIASKLTSHYVIINPEKIRKVLQKLGHTYSLDSIRQSEIRVLRTLNFEVMVVSPLLHIETILEVMGRNDPDEQVKLYHDTCLKLLDLLYIKYEEIYEKLYQKATGQKPCSTKDKLKIAAVKQNNMLKSVAIITSACYMVKQTNTDKVVENLSQITRIPCDDILDFATVIIQEVL